MSSFALANRFFAFGIMNSWEVFLKQVDDSPDETLCASTQEFFVALGFKSPATAVGVQHQKIMSSSSLPAELPKQAFINRTLNAVEATHKALTSAKGPAAPVATPLNSIGDLSALSVAQQLVPPKSCDVPKLLLDKKLDDLKFINQVEQPIFDRLHAETEAAKVASRTPFLYVDLTDKHVLPLWIHPEQVGGKMKWTDALDDEDDGYAKLGRALKGATEASRFFRSFAQWSAAFWRYAVAAVATDQMKWTWAIAHSDQVCQLAESERHAGRGPYVAFVYDDMLRRQIATRCVKKDPALKMSEAFESIDKELLQVVRQRLESVLVDAGISSSRVVVG